MPKYLIPLASRVDALSEIISHEVSRGLRKLLIKLSNGLLLLVNWKFSSEPVEPDKFPEEGSLEFLSLITTQDTFNSIGFHKLHIKGVASEAQDVVVTCSSSGQVTYWSVLDGSEYKTFNIVKESSFTCGANTSTGKYYVCSFVPGILKIFDPTTFTVLKTHNLDQWIVKLKVLGLVSDTVEQFAAATSNNEIAIYQLNRETFSWELKFLTAPLDNRECQSVVAIETFKYDPLLFSVCFDNILAIYKLSPSHLICLDRIPIPGSHIITMAFCTSDCLISTTQTSITVSKIQWDMLNVQKSPDYSEKHNILINEVYKFPTINRDGEGKVLIPDFFSSEFSPEKKRSKGVIDFVICLGKYKFAIVRICIVDTKKNSISFGSYVEFLMLQNKPSTAVSASNKPQKLISANEHHLLPTDPAYVDESQPPSNSPPHIPYHCETDRFVYQGSLNSISVFKLDVWLPFGLQEAGEEPCCSTITMNNKLVLSYPQGFILCVPLEHVALRFIGNMIPSKINVLSSPDLGKVVSMHCTGIKDRVVLFTGNNRGAIHAWCLEKYKLTHTFYIHSEAVVCFFMIPPEINLRTRSLLITMSSDNLVAVFSLNPISYLYTLPAHDARITELYWHESEELLAIETVARNVSIWQLRTGYLDRKLDSYEAKDVLQQFDWSIKCKYLMSHKPSCGGIFSIEIIKGNMSADYLFIFLAIDIPRLVYSIFVQHSEKIKFSSKDHMSSHHFRQQLCQWNMGLRLNFDILRSVIVKLLEMSGSDPLTMIFQNNLSGFPVDIGVPISLTLPYTISGFRTESSIILTRSHESSKWFWTTSPELSAAKILEIMLKKCILYFTENNEIPKNLSEKVAVLLSKISNLLGPYFCPPSIEYLSKYWFGSSGIPRSTNKHVFKGVLYFTPEEITKTLISRCYSNIPNSSNPISETSLYSVFLLSIIATVNIKLLSDPVPVAKCLLNLANSKVNVAYTVLAIELLGYDSTIWTKFVDGAVIFNTLFSISELKDESYISSLKGASSKMYTDEQNPSQGNKTMERNSMQKSVDIKSNEVDTNPYVSKDESTNISPKPRVYHTVIHIAHDHKELFNTIDLFKSYTWDKVREVALASLVFFCSVNSNLFVSILAESLYGSQNPLVCAGGFRLLGILLHKTPLVLYRHIPLLVNIMIKSMDPNKANPSSNIVRKIVAANLSEITMLFPNVAFSLTTQRLIVGVHDGSLVIYDVRTATRIQVVEAHLTPVTAVSFSPEGRLFVSYSLDENVVRFWQASGGGFLSSLIGAFNPNVTHSVHNVSRDNGPQSDIERSQYGSSVMVGQMRLFRTFALGKQQTETPSLMDIIQNTKFTWVSNRFVILRGPNNLEIYFNV